MPQNPLRIGKVLTGLFSNTIAARNKRGTVLVIVVLALVASAALLIRRTHAENSGPGTITATAPLAPPAPSGSAVRGAAQLPSTFKPVVRTSVANGISPLVRNLPVIKKPLPTEWEGDSPRPLHPPKAPPMLPVHDPVQQTNPGLLLMAQPNLTFDGMDQASACGNCIPPDPNGDVGPNHYVEMVNSSFAVYSKAGSLMAGPTDINQLFQGLPAGAPCRVDNDGDPVVVYDHLADRWLLSQFAVNAGNGPYDECFAVSSSPDPTGSYYVYDFHHSDTVFHDYPKLGVWPDAYYMTTNQFGGAAQTFIGAGAFAYERDKMLLGQPAREVFFDLSTVNSSFGGMLPSDLDGAPPPAGSPNYFAEVDSMVNSPSLGADAMRIWQFHVDWTNPAALSTFGLNGLPNFVLPVAMWNPSQCVEGQGTCVPQLGSPYQLDVIGDRIMFRLAYRNFGDHESLVVNHSVLADARIGVRWYEVRNLSSAGGPTIYQQSTFAPTDALYRWMGSIAMDHSGDIAVGYSTSSAASYPSIAWAGRLAGDPLNQLTQGEAQMFAGTGSENVGFYVPPVGRWGDYSDLTVDPTDDCTFWYVNEYFDDAVPDPSAPWRTRIGSFRFPQCVSVAPTPTPTPTATATPTPTPTPTATPTPNPAACINTPIVVVTDPDGDQGPGPVATNPSQVDIQSISVGEDYEYIGSPRLVFKLKVNNLTSVPANQIWNVRWNFGSPTSTNYYVAMKSDGSSNVNYEYGTIATNMVTTVGGIESGSFAADGTITMIIAMSKVGNPAAGQILTGVNGVTQMNVGGTLFTGEDSTSSANYTVRAMNAPCTPVPIPTAGSATYLKGGMEFSPNYTTRAPYIGQDVEPSIRSDKFGNTYVAAIRGVPGGTDLWYFDLRPTVNGAANPNYDPFMRNPQYRGQPDSLANTAGASAGGDGGGDVDIAVGFNSEATENPNAPPTLAYASLVAANISAQRSTDRGVTFTPNPAGNVTGGVPGDDRQWLEFFGSSTVYLIYRTLAPAIAQVQRSTDGGLTYGPSVVVGLIGQVGGVDVDQNDGTVYLAGSNGVVAVGTPVVAGQEPATYTIHNVAGTGNAHLFFVVKVAADGTVYVCYSDDHDVFVKFSTDKGNTWSAPIRVSDYTGVFPPNPTKTTTSIFPWMETGPTPGTIGVVWYGANTNSSGHTGAGDDSADWRVYYAQGTGVTSGSPAFRQVQASDHVIHGSDISESGLVVAGGSPNRNLADFFQIAFDPTGAAVIAYADDHNDLSGHTYVTRQTSGPGVNNGLPIPASVEGSALPAPVRAPIPTAASVGGIPGSQVTDFRDDVRSGGNPQLGGILVLPNDDPTDILSIKYSTEGTVSAPVLAVTMKVSDMTAIPPDTNWRMNFTANAPNSVMSPTGEYTFGVSDRGDQFFVRATTDHTGAQTFVYGKATRNFDGSITYTDIGAADFGAFDQTNKTITIKVAVGKLAAALTNGHTVGLNSVLVGLRGSTFTSANVNTGSNRTDTARGGTQYTISLTRTNYALAANGGVASASTTYPYYNFGPSNAIDGDRKGANWGGFPYSGWNDGNSGVFPDMLQVDFSPSSKTIDEINVFTLQNNWTTAGEPDLTTPATGEGILDFHLEMWNGTSWLAIPNCGCSVTGNDKAWRQFTFPAIETTRIRVVVTDSRNYYSRIVELEAVGAGGQP